MLTWTFVVLFSVLISWNLFLHLKLTRESRQRRELAIAFRQFTIDRLA